jgi:hypothetical protein
MSAVTGPPSELDERRDELTPMLQQYVDRCREHDDALVLFRVGTSTRRSVRSPRRSPASVNSR